MPWPLCTGLKSAPAVHVACTRALPTPILRRGRYAAAALLLLESGAGGATYAAKYKAYLDAMTAK